MGHWRKEGSRGAAAAAVVVAAAALVVVVVVVVVVAQPLVAGRWVRGWLPPVPARASSASVCSVPRTRRAAACVAARNYLAILTVAVALDTKLRTAPLVWSCLVMWAGEHVASGGWEMEELSGRPPAAAMPPWNSVATS